MSIFSIFEPGWTRRTSTALELFLYRLSIYGVPTVIGVMSIVALLTFDKQYTAGAGKPVEFRVFEQTGEAPTLAQARLRLANRPTVVYQDTNLSGSPFWFSFSVRPLEGDQPVDAKR